MSLETIKRQMGEKTDRNQPSMWDLLKCPREIMLPAEGGILGNQVILIATLQHLNESLLLRMMPLT